MTREGVVLPKGAKIPKGYIENIHRSSSYGIVQNGKFLEKVRIDPATLPGKKGPDYSHFHIDKSPEHSINSWPWY